METISILPTDSEIAEVAKTLIPYPEGASENYLNKLASKRRRFIRGATWMRDEIEHRMSEGSHENSPPRQ